MSRSRLSVASISGEGGKTPERDRLDTVIYISTYTYTYSTWTVHKQVTNVCGHNIYARVYGIRPIYLDVGKENNRRTRLTCSMVFFVLSYFFFFFIYIIL